MRSSQKCASADWLSPSGDPCRDLRESHTRAPLLARRLADAWATRPDVAAVVLRTPDEGLAEFKQMSDLAGTYTS